MLRTEFVVAAVAVEGVQEVQREKQNQKHERLEFPMWLAVVVVVVDSDSGMREVTGKYFQLKLETILSLTFFFFFPFLLSKKV